MPTKFKVGDKVVDRDGFYGIIVKVTLYQSEVDNVITIGVWYDVRFSGGIAVRYDSDLTKL